MLCVREELNTEYKNQLFNYDDLEEATRKQKQEKSDLATHLHALRKAIDMQKAHMDKQNRGNSNAQSRTHSKTRYENIGWNEVRAPKRKSR